MTTRRIRLRDGDGKAELIVGFGEYPATGGWLQILDDSTQDFQLIDWVQRGWDAYDQANGELRPSAGR